MENIKPASNTCLNCLVVDDESIAREGIIEYIERLDFLKVVGVCSSAMEAAEFMKSNEVDLMFLDIQMPHLTGLDFLESLQNPPLTIFTTAYSEYALDGFRLQVVDYLLKPISFKRFFQATLKAQEMYKLRHQSEADNSHMFVRQGDSFIRVIWMEILYIESMQNYLKLHFKDRTLIIYQTMVSIESMLPKDAFFRVHKSYLVNVFHIDLITGGRILINGNELPISRQRKEELFSTIVYKNLISK